MRAEKGAEENHVGELDVGDVIEQVKSSGN